MCNFSLIYELQFGICRVTSSDCDKHFLFPSEIQSCFVNRAVASKGQLTVSNLMVIDLFIVSMIIANSVNNANNK